jgi:hypothetical protein
LGKCGVVYNIPLFDSNVNVYVILTDWYIAVSVFLFSKCDKYSELQLFRQAVMKLIMKTVHAIYNLTAVWNSYCAVKGGVSEVASDDRIVLALDINTSNTSRYLHGCEKYLFSLSYLPVCTRQFVSHWTDFHEILSPEFG